MPNTILIADDNAHSTAGTLRAFFESLTFRSVEKQRTDKKDAIEKAQQLRPDLIILDLSMPVMNGLDAARKLKKLMPSVPIILFTLHCFSFVDAEARAAGVAA